MRCAKQLGSAPCINIAVSAWKDKVAVLPTRRPTEPMNYDSIVLQLLLA